MPQDIYQIAKVAKVLLLLEKGNSKDYRGKTLNEKQLEKDIYYSDSSGDENRDTSNSSSLPFEGGINSNIQKQI